MGVIVPAGSSLLVDVSSCQQAIDWPAAVAWRGPLGVRIDGAITKCTEGNADNADPQFAANWRGIASIGLPRGAYHFAHPDMVHTHDAEDEAWRFVFQILKTSGYVGTLATFRSLAIPAARALVLSSGCFRPGVDFLALDIEDQRSPVGRVFTDWVLTFCETVDALTAAVCGIYTGGPFFDAHDGTPDAETLERLRRRWLWLAAYVTDPERYRKLLGGWADEVVIHQRGGDIAPSGEDVLHVAGIHGNVDRDIFPGTRAQLEARIASWDLRPNVREQGLELGDGGPANPIGTADRAEDHLRDTDPAPPLESLFHDDGVPTRPDSPGGKSQPRFAAVKLPVIDPTARWPGSDPPPPPKDAA